MVKRYSTEDIYAMSAVNGPPYYVLETDYDALAAELASQVAWKERYMRDILGSDERIRDLEAENARLNMEMAAYRQGCTPKDAAAMLAVVSALQAEKSLRETGSLPPLNVQEFCEGCPPVGYPTDETRCAPCPRRCSPLSDTAQDRGGEHG